MDKPEDKNSTAPDCRCVFCGRVWTSKEFRLVCPVCENSADPRVPIPDGMRPSASANERLRLAMLFIEEWSNWWSYALGVDDNAPMPQAEKDAAGKMAESLGARARDMVIENCQFLAGAVPESRTINAAANREQETTAERVAAAAPTPRTDAAEHERDRQPCGWVWADFARQLERELAEDQEELARLRHDNAYLVTLAASERTAAMEAQDSLRMARGFGAALDCTRDAVSATRTIKE